MSNNVERDKQARRKRAQSLLARAADLFKSKAFRPHPLFKNGHAQTLAAYAWPRRFRFASEKDQERLFEVEPGVKVLAHCRWHAAQNDHSTLVLWHGIEGSTASNYMLAMAEKGFGAGFNIVRVNIRNCGGTEHLTPTLYHGGLSEDLRAVVKELIDKDGISKMVLAGFSLGGNLVLKLAGEYGEDPPPEILGVCAVSPSIDLTASANLIVKRSNWIYQQDFVRRLKKRIRTKHKLFPKLYDINGLGKVRTLRQFDERFTAPSHGFANAADYYYRSSSLRVIDRIRIPTLIIHAADDPFIPFEPLLDPAVVGNPFVLLIATDQGGHVAFISERRTQGVSSEDGHNGQVVNDTKATDDIRTKTEAIVVEDRFWAENRLIDFCQLVVSEE